MKLEQIASSVAELIGGTPMLALNRLAAALSLPAAPLVKLEAFNPAGSVKDRAALSLIADAEARGLLKAGGTIVEPTSGNTGIGLASVAASRGYTVVLTMPDSMSAERRQLLAAYGARIELTPGALGMRGAIERAEEILRETPNAFMPGQFTNPANADAHYRTTGPELWRQTDGRLDAFVAGVGTGGTLTGVARFLREKNPAVRVVAVEPAGSPVLSGGKAGAHGLMGIGAGFVPEVLDRALISEVRAVTEADAYAAARLTAKHEGILIGITGGAALHAAISLLREDGRKALRVAALMPDSGERYLSTPLFGE